MSCGEEGGTVASFRSVGRGIRGAFGVLDFLDLVGFIVCLGAGAYLLLRLHPLITLAVLTIAAISFWIAASRKGSNPARLASVVLAILAVGWIIYSFWFCSCR